MNFVESRLLGVHIDDSGTDVVLSFLDAEGRPFHLNLHGVEKLLVSEMRQQNIVEDVVLWRQGVTRPGFREAAFPLLAGVNESDASDQLSKLIDLAEGRVFRGELELLEITAVFGAQVLASFAKAEFFEGRPVPPGTSNP